MVPEGDGHGKGGVRAARPGARRALAAGVAAALLVAGGAVGVSVGLRVRPRPRQEVAAATIVAQVKRIAKLATVEAHEAQILKVEEGTPVFYLFESRKNALLLVKGRVLAGVDMEKARIVLTEDGHGRVLEVSLPPAEILAVDPQVEFYDEEAGWLNPITPEDRTAWLKLARTELLRAAEAGQVRERASAHARELLEAMGTGLGLRVEVSGAVPARLPAARDVARE